jgi:putative photosynthetic complex assembly protein
VFDEILLGAERRLSSHFSVFRQSEGNFVRGTMRGLARERKRSGIGATPPFILSSRADGRLTLEDPQTGRHVDLEAFGQANAGVFARYVALARSPR